MIKKTVLILLLISFVFTAKAFAEIIIVSPPTATHSKPPIKAAVKKPLPLFLLKRVNLTGNLTVPQALSLLNRSTGYSFIIDSHDIDSKKAQNYYFIDKPLYQVLKAVVLANGYYYSADTETKTVTVQGFVTRIFHLPLSSLTSSFSSQTGMSGVNSMANNGNGATPALTAPASGAATATGSAASAGSSGQNASNPGGTISMGMNETGSFEAYLKKALKSMTSKNGKFSIDARHGIVWVRDYYSNVRRISRFLKKVGKRMQSAVLLKVEVIDVGLNKNFQAGINWNTVFNDAFRSNALSVSSIAIGMPLAGGAGINNAPNISFSSASGANQAVLNALSTQGQTKVLSEPRLMLMDGQTRTISSGEINSYVQTVETLSYGVGSTTSTYPVIAQVQTGIGISFTPIIDKKTGEVTVTVNFVDNDITGYDSFSIGGNTFNNPIIQSKSFTDTVRVKSGRTAIIGGILTTNINKQTYGVPILEYIPVLGNLFKAVNNIKTKDDLVIMITPVITGGE